MTTADTVRLDGGLLVAPDEAPPHASRLGGGGGGGGALGWAAGVVGAGRVLSECTRDRRAWKVGGLGAPYPWWGFRRSSLRGCSTAVAASDSGVRAASLAGRQRPTGRWGVGRGFQRHTATPFVAPRPPSDNVTVPVFGTITYLILITTVRLLLCYLNLFCNTHLRHFNPQCCRTRLMRAQRGYLKYNF